MTAVGVVAAVCDHLSAARCTELSPTLSPAQLDEACLAAVPRRELSKLPPTSEGVAISDQVDDDEGERSKKAVNQLGTLVVNDSSPEAGKLLPPRKGKIARRSGEEDDAADELQDGGGVALSSKALDTTGAAKGSALVERLLGKVNSAGPAESRTKSSGVAN